VIVTAYSGNMDFTNPETAMLVDCSLVPVGPGAEPYDPNSRWADPHLEEAAKWMDRVLRDGALRSGVAEAGRRYVHTHLSPDVVGAIMKERLEEIRARRAAPKNAWRTI
jgi:hypothetical protein